MIKIPVSADYDLPSLIRAVGGDPADCCYSDGALQVSDSINADALKAAIAAVDPLDSPRAAKRAELDAACTAQIYTGFTSDALGAAYHYPAQDKDQQNLTASVVESTLPNLPADWTTPFWCADANGVWALRPHTVAQIQQAGRDGKAVIVAAITQNGTLQKQVAAADTIEAIQAIVWPGASQ